MASFWRTKDFKAAARTWNKILEETGFEDAEVDLKDDRALKQRASNSYRQASEIERESRLNYYLLLGGFVTNTNFQNTIDQLVMIAHSEGKKIREIVSELLNIGISRDRKTIRYIIRRYEAKWGIKNWTLKQMNLKK